ncbi:hypothetical protein [Paraburkholderia diazotrophica]|uniref:hypothetical protein n=1 Tax=Paraburkholderia diazotrophica TaxID=667676 RepID=UPI003172F8E3
MTIQLTGELLIAGRAKRDEGAPFQAIDAATREPIAQPVFRSALSTDVDKACGLADETVDVYRALQRCMPQSTRNFSTIARRVSKHPAINSSSARWQKVGCGARARRSTRPASTLRGQPGNTAHFVKR